MDAYLTQYGISQCIKARENLLHGVSGEGLGKLSAMLLECDPTRVLHRPFVEIDSEQGDNNANRHDHRSARRLVSTCQLPKTSLKNELKLEESLDIVVSLNKITMSLPIHRGLVLVANVYPGESNNHWRSNKIDQLQHQNHLSIVGRIV